MLQKVQQLWTHYTEDLLLYFELTNINTCHWLNFSANTLHTEILFFFLWEVWTAPGSAVTESTHLAVFKEVVRGTYTQTKSSKTNTVQASLCLGDDVVDAEV